MPVGNDDPVALPADTTIRNPGPQSMTNLGAAQVQPNAVGSIVLPADVTLRLPGSGNREQSTNELRSATLPRDTVTNAVVPRQREAVAPKK